MTSAVRTVGRSRRKLAIGGTTLAIAGSSLLLWTELPADLASGAGASTALAELAARSPGIRIGGAALKAKTKRAKPTSLVKSTSQSTAEEAPGLGAPASPPLGASGPDGLSSAPATLGAFPGQVASPGETPIVVQPVPIGGVGFVPVPGGGGVIIGPGGGGAGGLPGGGTGGVIPSPTPTTTPAPAPTPSPTSSTPIGSPSPTPALPPASAVPEPSTWLMLISGFGFLGAYLRRRRRVLGTI